MKQQAMKKQSGFTLIELVIVIIILGILAATAVPKFVDMQSDARKAAMKGLKGALEGAATLTYSKAALDGTQKKDDGTTKANGVIVAFGYPEASETALKEAAGLAEGDWTIVEGAKLATITAAGATSGATSTCKVTYTEAADETHRPKIEVTDSGC